MKQPCIARTITYVLFAFENPQAWISEDVSRAISGETNKKKKRGKETAGASLPFFLRSNTNYKLE